MSTSSKFDKFLQLLKEVRDLGKQEKYEFLHLYLKLIYPKKLGILDKLLDECRKFNIEDVCLNLCIASALIDLITITFFPRDEDVDKAVLSLTLVFWDYLQTDSFRKILEEVLGEEGREYGKTLSKTLTLLSTLLINRIVESRSF